MTKNDWLALACALVSLVGIVVLVVVIVGWANTPTVWHANPCAAIHDCLRAY
jgi:hypothetical protein